MSTSKESPIVEASYDEVKLKLRRRRASPRMGEWSENEEQFKQPEYLSNGWSDTRSGRGKRVVAALYGDDGTGKPELELLVDETERLDKNKEADRAQGL